ncbi:glycoside hydrolase family 2 TIM barrel-domain containing protein [Alteromonas sp. CYL-A6]|uniref:glycoside hydrolase family 2 TIM barrel-domain containing protein n=1 Tax=Alteromonas nitratireducens TaxID=3390813 RepID=UPI0034AF5C6E
MRPVFTPLIIGIALFVAQQTAAKSGDEPVPVSLQKNEHGYQIVRGGTPFFIRGAGGSSRLEQLAESGGNAIRTWSSDNAEEILDRAHKAGLVVMLGLRLGHERHGFDYNDKTAVAAQFERVKQTVLRYKDHPALLAWGIGNEVDLFYTNTNVWFAVEEIAAFIQKHDPHHLVTTVTAGIDKPKLDLVLSRVPSIDYLSINIYGGLETLPATLLDYGYDGPFVVTEWGPTGHWQVEKTAWGVPIEQTSTEKAASYRQRYQDGIVAAPGRALGSFAFLWGQKQETTPTWYGVFTENGQPTEVVDSLTYNWTGQWPDWRAPSIHSLRLQGQSAKDSIQVAAGEAVSASVILDTRSDPSPSLRIEVLPESTDIKAGGDPESRPQSVTDLNVQHDSNGNITFHAPQQRGAYRLFIYVTDSRGHVANANIPFYVSTAD